ncbi:hypothetical protein C0J52_01027 [Blattella germanica]|nr:hypothetical protein C0J52_01027 [Blattella germanica]
MLRATQVSLQESKATEKSLFLKKSILHIPGVYLASSGRVISRTSACSIAILPAFRPQMKMGRLFQTRDYLLLQQCKDFFGRVVQPVPGSSSTARKEKTDEIVKSDIWYHYQEGFSNAVRRSLKMKELLEPRM